MNTDLQTKYNEMHAQGPSAWSIPGRHERNMIYNFVDCWEGKQVLEIGCGEGDLAAMLAVDGAYVLGVDYSTIAIKKAMHKYRLKNLFFLESDYKDTRCREEYDIVIMQGVLEHLDHPWMELKWMVEHLLKSKGCIITTSPCFVNARGILWMYLHCVYQLPMSLTDLHFLHPWEFEDFAKKNGFELIIDSTDHKYGFGKGLDKDFKSRLPKAHHNHPLCFSPLGLAKWLKWLDKVHDYVETEKWPGATAGYKFFRE